MTPDPNDDTSDDAFDENDNEPPNTSASEGGRSDEGLFAPLRRLLEALAEIEDDGGTRRESDRVTQGSTTIDYEYDVTIGLGRDERNRFSERGDFDQRTFRVATDDGTQEYRVELREAADDNGIVVFADLPDVSEDAIDIALTEDNTLELLVGDEVIERIPLEGTATIVTDVRFNNGILEVHLNPDNGDYQ